MNTTSLNLLQMQVLVLVPNDIASDLSKSDVKPALEYSDQNDFRWSYRETEKHLVLAFHGNDYFTTAIAHEHTGLHRPTIFIFDKETCKEQVQSMLSILPDCWTDDIYQQLETMFYQFNKILAQD